MARNLLHRSICYLLILAFSFVGPIALVAAPLSLADGATAHHQISSDNDVHMVNVLEHDMEHMDCHKNGFSKTTGSFPEDNKNCCDGQCLCMISHCAGNVFLSSSLRIYSLYVEQVELFDLFEVYYLSLFRELSSPPPKVISL